MILRAFSKTNFIISIKIFIEIIKAKSSHAIKMFEPLLSVRRYSHGNLQHHWNNSRHREPDGDRIHRAEQGKIFRPFLTFGLFNPKGAFTLTIYECVYLIALRFQRAHLAYYKP